MACKKGRTLLFDRLPRVEAFAAVAGEKEAKGPLGKEFDRIFVDPYLGKNSYEAAESEMQRQAAELALQKAGITPSQLGITVAGDLLNQCVGSTVGLSGLGVPHIGVYGACSTMALSLLLSSCLIENDLFDHALAVTSSHFCASERQFRLPLEYGGQRPQTAQWTATAAGAVLVGHPPAGVVVKGGIFGRVMDLGIKDANQMGAAMAPAAADTIVTFLRDTGKAPEDFDRIITGDLGAIGSKLLCELAQKEGYDLTRVHTDCGLLMYHMKEQDVHSGGSGCGCSAGVLCARFLPHLQTGRLKQVLFVATGALHSPTVLQQGTPIPGIAHGVWLSAE